MAGTETPNAYRKRCQDGEELGLVMWVYLQPSCCPNVITVTLMEIVGRLHENVADLITSWR